jgi:DNA-directed RNA polymerase specialized sigma24 family protein
VDSPVSLKKQWILTQQAFDRLLASLDADREQAGQKYERIRLKLVKFFEWRGIALPDGEVDETINRVARRIEEGQEIHNLNAYFYGVARMVFAESLKARAREQDVFGLSLAVVEPPADDPGALERHECLDRCLQHLSEESRKLIIEYYQDEKSRKIEHRKELALRLGIPLNALRIRAYRIRASLEACLRECLERQV